MRLFASLVRATIALTCLALPTLAAAQADGDVGLCGAELDFAPIVESAPDGALIVSRFEPGDDGTTYVLRATVYTCDSCSNGTCYPTWNGQKAGCTSATCTVCGLKADGVPVGRTPAPGGGCADPSDDALARAAAIADYTAALELPEPTYENGEARAPEGFLLAVEDIDGTTLAYLVPEGDPGPDGAALRLYVGKAKCRCSGTGTCKWDGIICKTNHDCDDGCEIEVKGASMF